MARENSGWRYDRIVGALANLGHHVSDQTVGNILRRHDGIAPAPKRSQILTWKHFLAAHMNVLAGCDFFTVEVPHLAWAGNVLRSVVPSFGKPPRERRRDHPTSRPRMDGANRSKCDAGHLGLSSRVSLCFARSRHEVLCFLSVGTGNGRRQNDTVTGQEPESQRVCGTMGPLRQAGMSI